MNYMPTATMNTTVLIQENKSWSDALNDCKLYHTDLATIENQDENTKLQLLLSDQNVVSAYIGLIHSLPLGATFGALKIAVSLVSAVHKAALRSQTLL